MITEYNQGGYSLSALARRHSISRKTAYKWIERFELEQWEGLQERSRARHTQAHAYGDKVEQRVLEYKAQWPLWGAPKIHHKLVEELGEGNSPSESTVGNILRRSGLTQPMKARRVKAPPAVM